MKPQFFWLFLFLIIGSGLQASNPRISLITCDPGVEVYSVYGHSAFRMQDTIRKIDRIYNYGIFDFDTPNFTLKFAQGKLDYFLGVEPMGRFLAQYEFEERDVYEQELLLTDDEARKIVQFLDWNRRPENRAYKYDFFYDNCASKMRDILEEQLGASLVYPPEEEDLPSFRDLLDEYIADGFPWMDFGIDLILGLPTDKDADFRNQMFLPDYLSANLGKAKVKRNGVESPLSGPKIKIQDAPEQKVESGFFTPILFTFLLALILSGLAFLKGKEKLNNRIDAVVWTIFGIVGTLWVVMWTLTDHQATYWNLNLLWTGPWWFVVMFFMGRLKKTPEKQEKLILGIAAWHVLLLVAFWILPQALHLAVLPLIAMQAVRAWARWRRVKGLAGKPA